MFPGESTSSKGKEKCSSMLQPMNYIWCQYSWHFTYSFTSCLPSSWTCKVIRMANSISFYWPVMPPSSLSCFEHLLGLFSSTLNQNFAVCSIDYLLLSNLLMWTAKASTLVIGCSFIQRSVIVHSNCSLLNHLLYTVNVRYALPL